MRVVIFGCGRTGSTLAVELVARGHDVTIIEQNPEALRRIGAQHGCTIILGSGIDEDVLEKAGLRDADAFIAVTRGDNTNLMAAQIAHRKYGVKNVCIKVADPHRAHAYREMGYFCINAASLLAGMMVDWIHGEPYRPIDEYNALPKELEI